LGSGIREIKNESGCFAVDREGQLLRFSPNADNEVGCLEWYPIKCRRAVRHLHIPEGVRFVGNGISRQAFEDFDRICVMEEITLPGSLLCIRGNAFWGCFIQKIILPPSLRQLGGGAFMHCYISRLVIMKESLRLEHAEMNVDALRRVAENELLYEMRCFKESLILELCVEGPECEGERLKPAEQRRPAEAMIRERLLRDAQVIEMGKPLNTGRSKSKSTSAHRAWWRFDVKGGLPHAYRDKR